MICEECRTEIEALSVICPGCGARVARDRAKREQADWREQVRESVERHKLKKRRRLEERDDDARQLSIFPDALEDDESRAERQRRAEIRHRVEERMAKRRPTPAVARRRIELGELPIRSGAAAAREVFVDRTPERALALDTDPRRARRARGLDRDRDRDRVRADPTTAEFDPVSPSQSRSATATVSEPDLYGDDARFAGGLDLAVDDAGFDLREAPGDDAPARGEPDRHSDSELDFGLASVGGRVTSAVIDLVFVVGIQLTLFYLTTHLVSQRIGALPSSALAAMGIVGAVLAAGYFLFFWALSGQTLGKLLTGARVVGRGGKALGFGGAAARLAGCALAALPLGAGFIGLLTDPERRGWHDRLAGSKVVRG